jgi:biotin carboxyl carrier protein
LQAKCYVCASLKVVQDATTMGQVRARTGRAESRGAETIAPVQPTPGAVPADAAALTDLGGKSVLELQNLIERAFVLLDRAAEEQAHPAVPPEAPAATGADGEARIGAGEGSALAGPSATFARRAAKSLLALVAAVAIGILPLQRLLTPASTEAFVNAPLHVLSAPATGTLAPGALAVGTRVERDAVIARVAGATGSRPVAAPAEGVLWEVSMAPGDRVAAGQEVARLASCTAVSVTAAVSETVYDRLVVGLPARFNFYGDDRFYDGTVAALLGHSIPAGAYAIPPQTVAADALRVVVSVPGLADLPLCSVGRRGEVVFGASAPGRAP